MSEKFQLVLDVAQKAQVPSPGGGRRPDLQARLVRRQPACPSPAPSSVAHT